MPDAAIPIPPWRPDDRDLVVVGVMYEAGFLVEAQIRLLYGLAAATVNARIKKMLAAGVVERARPPSTLPPQQVPYLYQVTVRAHKFLPATATGRFRVHRPISEMSLASTTIDHPLDVGAVIVALLLGLPGNLPAGYSAGIWGEHRSQILLPAQGKLGKSQLQPDALLRLLAGEPPTWAAQIAAPAWASWRIEVDRGTEDEADWIAKIGRYRRAPETPPLGLLVTVPAEKHLVPTALWIAHAAAKAGIASPWPVWMAVHKIVADPATAASPAWRQVQIHAKVDASNALMEARWTLPAILLPGDQPYPVTAAREAREAREREARAQQERDRATPAATTAATIPAEWGEITDAQWRAWTQPDPTASARAEAERQAEATRRRIAEEEAREALAQRRLAEAARFQAEAAAAERYRRSFRGRLAAAWAWWVEMPAELRNGIAMVVVGAVGVFMWVAIFNSLTPSLGEVFDQADDGRGLIWHLDAPGKSPQGWMLFVTFLALCGALGLWGQIRRNQ